MMMGQTNRNIRWLWPLVSIAALVALTIAAATGSGLETASSRSLLPPPYPPVTSQPHQSSGCNGTAPSGSSNLDHRDGLDKVLVPTSPTAPVYVTICRYAGMDQQVPPGELERSRVLNGQELSDLVEYIDNPDLQTVSLDSPISCPMATGGSDTLQFVYSSGPDVTLSIPTSGCQFVSNGERTVWPGSIGQKLAEYVGSNTFGS
jgi:hypothetical protein